MKVQEVMTQEVLTIGPEAPVRDVAKILVDHRISGLPVCDAQRRVLGVISEGDILFKEHDPTTSRRIGPLAWLVDGASKNAVAKAQARTAREAMTSPAITIAPHDSVAAAARVMSERGVNRLPVVKRGELVGIVTRADLVRAFVRSDEEIAREIKEDVLERMLWIEAPAPSRSTSSAALSASPANSGRAATLSPLNGSPPVCRVSSRCRPT